MNFLKSNRISLHLQTKVHKFYRKSFLNIINCIHKFLFKVENDVFKITYQRLTYKIMLTFIKNIQINLTITKATGITKKILKANIATC